MSSDVYQWYACHDGVVPGFHTGFPAMPDRPAALRFLHPLPYGAILHDGGVQFVVFSRRATAMRVLLYEKVNDREPSQIIDFDRDLNRWGDIWSIFVPGVGPGQLYHYQADGPHEPERGNRFDPKARLIDPYAKALAGEFLPATDGILRPPKCVVVGDQFDWQGDRHLRRSLHETIIYELHVRGFTKSRSGKVEHPGTYAGIIEKIPYLQSLGVTAVELMPVHEFSTIDCFGHKPERSNYWGYDPIAFFAPHRGYAVGTEPGGQVRQFKEMVRELHRAGIEVILDVVFNHTAEGNEYGPTLSFKGLENRVYYMLENGGRSYRNYTGCGNTLNGNHPIVRELIFHCLRYWVQSYHIDGFRFDLASILSRDRNGDIIPNPPVVESIAEDPLLADTKIIAEAWDAAGAYQVGTFANLRSADQPILRWAEWNGRYRDDVRRFWRSDDGISGPLATRLSGSSDLYQSSGRKPYHSINFITSHDGFTLSDLVSYSHKHNEANGEENRDGENHNHSYNYGVEGPTRRPAVEAVRLRQIKNMLATLLLSQGVPMILMGDECRRTQSGNNNAYCQDNAMSWFDWALVEKHKGLWRFCQALINFRRAEPTVRQTNFLRGLPYSPGGLPDVSWHTYLGGPMDWSSGEKSLVCILAAVPRTDPFAPPNHHVMLMLHAGIDARTFSIPPLARHLPWRLLLDTATATPLDIHPFGDGPAAPLDGNVTLEGRSMAVFVARDAG
ncbi:MAG: glycogen debranching protein GlgX [Pirellulales bacterium]|nr:glycogen debranching protein GlgX [Pirellulales bacterium]